MNLKNLAMWALIVLLSVGLFNMFQNPKNSISTNNQVTFSKFLNEVENGRVVEVNIQGNNITGVMSDGSKFKTFSPNYPNLVEKLSEKGISIKFVFSISPNFFVQRVYFSFFTCGMPLPANMLSLCNRCN